MTYEEITERNLGIVRNQNCLRNAKVSIGGCGGAGGETAVTLARMGVGSLSLADSDNFEISNLNRQFGATQKTVGLNKAEVIKEIIKEINPECMVKVLPKGIDDTNVDEFLKGSKIALEEIDYRKPLYTAIFHKTARRLDIPVMTAIPIAWGSFLFFFDPDGLTFEEYVGLNKHSKLEDFKNYSFPLKAYCPEPPFYLGSKLIRDVIKEKIEIPAIAPAVNLTAGILASFVYFYLSGEKTIKPVPYYYSMGDMFKLNPKRIPLYKKILFKLFANF